MKYCKITFFLLLCFTVNKSVAQQKTDSLPDYLKHSLRYFRVPGMPDSTTFFQRMDSSLQRQRVRDSLLQRYDSLIRQRRTIPTRTSLAYTIINKEGYIMYAEIEEGSESSCNLAALDLIKKMPKWNPARQNGRPVSCYQIIPLVFINGT